MYLMGRQKAYYSFLGVSYSFIYIAYLYHVTFISQVLQFPSEWHLQLDLNPLIEFGEMSLSFAFFFPPFCFVGQQIVFEMVFLYVMYISSFKMRP